MAFLLSNTGTFSDVFDDLETVLGTTLSWTLFDNVSADEKVYEIPPTTAGFSPVSSPSYVRLFRDTVAFSVRMTIYDSWQVGMGVGGATNPIPAVDATSKNILDFTSAIATTAYRIYGDAAEGYVCIIHDGSGPLNASQGWWIGVLVGRDTVANHPNPNAIFYRTSAAANIACDFLNQNLSAKNETDAQILNINGWTNSVEQHSGLAVLITAFASLTAPSAIGEIAGFAKDLFQCSGNFNFGDEISAGGGVFKVMNGGGYCIKE